MTSRTLVTRKPARRVASTVAVVVALVAVVGNVACESSPSAKACPQSGASCPRDTTISAELPVAPSELFAAKMTVCLRDLCSDLVDPQIPRDPYDHDSWLSANGALVGQALVHDYGGGWSRIEVPFVFARSADGAIVPGPEPQDGDSFKLSVRGRDGTSWLEVERRVTYERFGQTCDGVQCLRASIALSPTSKSGLSCGAVACTGGVFVHKRVTITPADAMNSVVTACHNEHCGTTQFFGRHDALSPELSLRQTTVKELGPNDYDVTFELDVPMAALRDGDRIRLEVATGTEVRASVDELVAYETSTPNGPECDSDPCRRVTIEMP